MEKLISVCGLNCATCDARIATVANDNTLRQQTAEKWSVMYGVPGQITAEMINCTGCRQEGVKFNHCYNCEISKCAGVKGFATCAPCPELESCKIVGAVHAHVPEALANLKELR